MWLLDHVVLSHQHLCTAVPCPGVPLPLLLHLQALFMPRKLRLVLKTHFSVKSPLSYLLRGSIQGTSFLLTSFLLISVLREGTTSLCVDFRWLLVTYTIIICILPGTWADERVEISFILLILAIHNMYSTLNRYFQIIYYVSGMGVIAEENYGNTLCPQGAYIVVMEPEGD